MPRELWYTRFMKRAWTESEIEYLKKNYPVLGRGPCAEKLGRTPKSIGRKAEQLKLSGRGLRSTHAEYEQKLLEKELDVFPVNKDYVNNRTPILHSCVEGHTWMLRPIHALEGRGCPTCASGGFKPHKPGLVYYVKIVFENLTYYKIGVTNRSVEERFEQDRRNKEITIIHEWKFERGQDALDLERLLLKTHPRVSVDNFLVNGGNTELFEYDVLELDNGRRA